MKLKSAIGMLRPAQWLKNGFVFLPMFFGGQMDDGHAWGCAWLAFVAFSLMASAVYCLNDMRDVAVDRIHPVKKNRPLASGQVSLFTVRVLFFLLVAASECISWLAFGADSPRVSATLTLYLLINIAYCYGMKKIAVVDVMFIAFGFVLRLLAGGLACGIVLSPWIVLMTFLLTLFMAFAKRRDDVILRERYGIETRKNTRKYNVAFLNQVLGILGAVTMVCYIMYTVSPEVVARLNNDYVYASSVFVLAALIRYLQVCIVEENSGSPTYILCHDHFIQGCGVCWITFFAILIYVR